MLKASRSWAISLLIVALVAAVATWAVMTVLRPADDPISATTFTLASVEQGEVGSSLNLNTVATWQALPIGTNQAAGVVTTVDVEAGQEVFQGSELYSVNLRPVVAAQGDVPAFRAIGEGVQGNDVAQLQSMLQALGYYSGTINGKALSPTVSAIRTWQRSLGVEQSGVVELGDVIFVPSVPTRITLDSTIITRGARLGGGEEVLKGLPDSPQFQVPVTDAQAAAIPTGTAVEITAPDGSAWSALTTDQTRDDQAATVTIGLSGQTGQTICGEQCSLIPVTGNTILTSRVVTVPTQSGLTVPSAALVTDAEGTINVVDQAGDRHPVTVVQSAQGMSVIEGVTEGTQVRVPAEGGGG